MKSSGNLLIFLFTACFKTFISTCISHLTSQFSHLTSCILSDDLKLSLGRGFSRSNLIYMRLFYLKYPISEKLSHLLSWSHYFELLKIDNDLERKFYEKQSIMEKWSKNKNDVLVEYATYGMNSRLFVKKYQLYLPNEEELRREIELIYEQNREDKNG